MSPTIWAPFLMVWTNFEVAIAICAHPSYGGIGLMSPSRLHKYMWTGSKWHSCTRWSGPITMSSSTCVFFMLDGLRRSSAIAYTPYLQLGCPFLPEMHYGVHMPMQHHLVIGCPLLTTRNTNRRDMNIINDHLVCQFQYFHCVHGGINKCWIGMYVNAWYKHCY